MKQRRALLLLLFFGMWWAFTIPLTKIAVSTGHPPIGLIFWQLLISGAIMFLVIQVQGRRIRLDRSALRHYLTIALLGTILPNSFSYFAAAQLPAGIMAIIIASVPMFAMLIALGIGLERLSVVRMIGVLLGALSVIVLIGPEASLPEPDKAVFVFVALVAPLCYGLEGNYISAKSPPGIDPVSALCGASGVGVLICAPLVWFGNYWVDLSLPWGAPEKALVVSSLIHALVYSGYIWLVGVTSAVFASQIAYVVTLGGVFFSGLILSERYSSWVFLALGLMIAGLILVQPRERKLRSRT
ncbi:MAG: DMT family transporter [bacterium]